MVKPFKEHFTTTKYGSEKAAKQARDKRARELRKQGWTVECKQWDFTNLARCVDFTLEAQDTGAR